MSQYIYDQAWESERERLTALEAMLDPSTILVLETIGVGPDHRCLEVGGGGGSITRWLCERAGSVVVTDLDTRFVEQIGAPNLEVRTHDIVNDPLEQDAFDLVHSRDVLEHIPEREQALDKMVAAVKPGGWIVAEDVDFAVDLYASEQGFGGRGGHPEVTAKIWRSARDGMTKAGVDAEYGRHLPDRLAARGLEQIEAEVHAKLIWAGSQGARLTELSITHLGPRLIEAGVLTEDELDTVLSSFRDPAAFWFGPLHVSAWGRKPA